jgi:hypothetical protein
MAPSGQVFVCLNIRQVRLLQDRPMNTTVAVAAAAATAAEAEAEQFV